MNDKKRAPCAQGARFLRSILLLGLFFLGLFLFRDHVVHGGIAHDAQIRPLVRLDFVTALGANPDHGPSPPFHAAPLSSLYAGGGAFASRACGNSPAHPAMRYGKKNRRPTGGDFSVGFGRDYSSAKYLMVRTIWLV
jgi:hypothetical protein